MKLPSENLDEPRFLHKVSEPWQKSRLGAKNCVSALFSLHSVRLCDLYLDTEDSDRHRAVAGLYPPSSRAPLDSRSEPTNAKFAINWKQAAVDISHDRCGRISAGFGLEVSGLTAHVCGAGRGS